MPAIDWSMLTALPKRIIGSLGPTKRDFSVVSNHEFYEPATESNLIRNCAGWLMECVGLPIGYAAGSLQGRLDSLEAEQEPGRYRVVDPFIIGEEPAAAPFSQYESANVSVPSDGDESGGIIAMTFSAADKYVRDWRYPWRRAHSLVLEMRVKLTSVEEDSDVRVGFIDSTNNNGFAFAFLPAFSSAWVLIGVDGGAPVMLPVGDPVVAGDWYVLRIRCNAAGDVFGSINGGAEIMLTPFILPDQPYRRVLMVAAGTEAGEEARFDYWLTEATFHS